MQRDDVEDLLFPLLETLAVQRRSLRDHWVVYPNLLANPLKVTDSVPLPCTVSQAVWVPERPASMTLLLRLTMHQLGSLGRGDDLWQVYSPATPSPAPLANPPLEPVIGKVE